MTRYLGRELMEGSVRELRRLTIALILLNWASTTALAQLHQGCTVSVLNRTVQVNAEGAWVLPNVPANFGPVRARATCVRNGVTRSGESEPFTLPANGVVNLPKIQFGQTTPIPTALTLSAPTTRLTAIGQATQFTVTARYSDSTTKDVTAGSAFTQYTVSNPAIATVSADGLAQAVTSGTVLIQATHEGATGMAAINVVLAGVDSDGDGIPDDYELAQGMNPNNPTDASEDFDRDGLTNLQEYLRGTDLRTPDTDGDGLSDGDEVARGTNPLLRDTDGDGISDGLEVATGSNPLDPGSVNLPGALSSIAVTPPIFTITFNTIAGDVFQQLKVTGTLSDGTKIDLTSKARGTNYGSSNVNVCNFGAGDGRVYAGVAGACTITVTVGGFTGTASGAVRTFSPIPLSSVALGGGGMSVDVNGNYAYVAVSGVGLRVVDVTNRSAPSIVATLALPGSANDVKLAGTKAYFAAGAAGLHIIDIANPLAPKLLGTMDTPGNASDVRVRGGLAYVADGPSGLQIIDVRSPDAPRIVGTVATAAPANGVDITDSHAVVAVGAAGVQIIDITNPSQPTVVGTVDTPGNAQDVVVKGTDAYVADYTGSLRVVDFTNAAAPVLGPATPGALGGFLLDVAIADTFVFGADEFFVNGVSIIDVTNPADPIPRAILNFPGDSTGRGIAVDGSFVYLVGDDGRMYIGQYRAQEDLNGIPPTISIASPAAGTTVLEGETVAVSVVATDDIGVVGVTLLVNGATLATDTTAPYQFNIGASAGAATFTLGAIAGDLGNNTGVAVDVLLNVVPDPLTTVVGLVLDPNGAPVNGAAITTLGGRAGMTGADGVFSVTGVPTILGDIVVRVRFTAPGGTLFTGRGGPVPFVRGGTTNIAVIRLTEGNIGQTPGNPAKSCLHIQQLGAAVGNRKYWIEVPSGVFEMHCNFSASTGGWTRVGALDGTQNYCTAAGATDMRLNPDASAGKIPDADTQAIMNGTTGSSKELMYFVRGDNRYVWHALQGVADFSTNNKHTSSEFYCPDWHCDNGTVDASVCGNEGDGCPVTAHGISGTTKKIYVDSHFGAHMQGFHSNGSICGLPNYARASIWIYVR